MTTIFLPQNSSFDHKLSWASGILSVLDTEGGSVRLLEPMGLFLQTFLEGSLKKIKKSNYIEYSDYKIPDNREIDFYHIKGMIDASGSLRVYKNRHTLKLESSSDTGLVRIIPTLERIVGAEVSIQKWKRGAKTRYVIELSGKRLSVLDLSMRTVGLAPLLEHDPLNMETESGTKLIHIRPQLVGQTERKTSIKKENKIRATKNKTSLSTDSVPFIGYGDNWDLEGEVLSFLKNYNTKGFKTLAEEERQSKVQELYNIYSVRSFPWSIMYRDRSGENIDRVLKTVNSSIIRINGDELFCKSVAGQPTCRAFFPHRLNAAYRTNKSVVEAYNDPVHLRKAIYKQCMDEDPIDPKGLVRQLSSMFRAPKNFPPAIAKWLIDEYCPEGGTVYDSCLGYGGRLLGSLASDRSVTYIGRDIEERSVQSGIKLSEALGVTSRVNLSTLSVEDWDPSNCADVFITSPPYYDTENYGSSAQKSLQQYNSYIAWRNGFLKSLVQKAIVSAYTVIINVSDIRYKGVVFPLEQDVLDLAKQENTRHIRTINWRLAKYGTANDKYEKIFIFRKDV